MNTVTALSTGAAPFQPESAPDYLPAAILGELQLGRLRSIVERAWSAVPLHRSRMKERGIEPGDLQSLEDIAALPFTTKADLRDTYPFGLFASPMLDAQPQRRAIYLRKPLPVHPRGKQALWL